MRVKVLGIQELGVSRAKARDSNLAPGFALGFALGFARWWRLDEERGRNGGRSNGFREVGAPSSVCGRRSRVHERERPPRSRIEPVTDDELKHLFDALQKENAAAHAETRRDFHDTADHHVAEMRHYFDVAMESSKHEIGLIAEKVTRLEEKLDQIAANLDERIERTAAETQAMIKFSHAELHRRMRSLEESQRTLEESLSDLQARVERLESSTH